MKFVVDDGGREASGRKGKASDCVTRAIAIAAELPYDQVYRDMAALNSGTRRTKRRLARNRNVGRNTASHGIYANTKAFKAYMQSLGFTWVSTMGIGTGCRVHLRDGELPKGRLVVKVSRHMCAVIDGVLHDTYDGSREGRRAVYGYWVQQS